MSFVRKMSHVRGRKIVTRNAKNRDYFLSETKLHEEKSLKAKKQTKIKKFNHC